MIQIRKTLSRNIWTSWAGYGVRIVVGFLFVPYITSVLGDDRFGIWVIVFQTVNYFTLLDFGLEKALLRFISKYLSQDNIKRINQILHTSFGLYLVVGSLIIAGVWLTATFLFHYIKIADPALVMEGKQALVIIGFYMGTRFFLIPFSGSLGGFQRFDISNGLHIFEDVVRAAIMVWLLANGYGLVALAITILVMSLVKQIAAIVILRRLYPQVDIGINRFDRTTARELFSYSRITFGITLAWLVIYNTDVVLLGLLKSSAAAGVYAPGAQMMLYLRNMVNVIASPLTSATSHLEASGNLEAVKRLYLKGIRYVSYVSFAAAVGVIIYARPFVALWLEPEFAETAGVMQILVIGTAFFVPQIIGNAILFGIDKHHLLLRVLILEAVLKLVLSLVLIGPFGLTGIAIASIAPQLLLYTTIYPYLVARELQLSAIWMLLTSLRSGLVAMFISLPIAIITRVWLPPSDWGAMAINIAIVCLPLLIGGYFILEPNDRENVKKRLKLS